MHISEQLRRIQAAQRLSNMGRNGDSMLVHMQPQEVAALQRMGAQRGKPLTVNPKTGLPEAFSLRDLFNINTYTDPIQRGMESIGLGSVYDTISDAAQTVGKNAQYVLPFIPGGTLAEVGLGALDSSIGRGLLGGTIGTFAGGSPNLKRGLMSGISAYGLSEGFKGLQDAGGGTGEVFEPTTVADTGLTTPPGAAPETPSLQTLATPPERSTFEAATQGIKNLFSGDKEVSAAAKAALGNTFSSGKAMATLTGVTGTLAIDEQEKALEEAKKAGEIAEADYQKLKARIAVARKRAEEAMKAHPYQYALGGDVFASGGEPLAGKALPDNESYPYGMKAGGDTGRFLNGPGDGMSDSIPATIDGTQPARLADGEFVIPADVVSHLGNGSTKAGAKQLYAMMDRIRQARTGTTKQGKQIKPQKFMPA